MSETKNDPDLQSALQTVVCTLHKIKRAEVVWIQARLEKTVRRLRKRRDDDWVSGAAPEFELPRYFHLQVRSGVFRDTASWWAGRLHGGTHHAVRGRRALH